MKAMRIVMVLFLVSVVSFCFWGAGTAFGAGGNGCSQAVSGIADQVLPVEDMDIVSGVVSDVTYPGLELTLDDDGGFSDVFGIGPYYFWEDEGAPRPDVDDYIVVTGQDIVLSDGTVNFVAFFITVYIDGEGVEVQMRDLDTGLPLWRCR